jgi:hypothetical protein
MEKEFPPSANRCEEAKCRSIGGGTTCRTPIQQPIASAICSLRYICQGG